MQSTERRLFLVSDVHIDSRENWRWLEQLSDTAYQHDALIVAGDVSEEIDRLEAALRLLTSKFSVVCFTPGNHDLWTEGDGDSLSKLHDILALCDRLKVFTTPCRFGDDSHAVWICPLLSFHTQSFDTEPEVEGWAIPTALEAMTDYRACEFPQPLSMLNDSVAAALDAMNDERTRSLSQRPATEPLVTFSHFLPRQELLPEKRFLFIPTLPKASGSPFLAARLAALAPTVHCFGHTHFAWVL